MIKPLTYHAAARYERKAFIAKIRRELRRCSESCKEVLMAMLNWGLKRRERFEKRPGGLGRTKAK
jgi:hypothetical protein